MFSDLLFEKIRKHPSIKYCFGIILGLKILVFWFNILMIFSFYHYSLMQIYGDEFSEETEDSPNDIVLPESEKPLQEKIDIDIKKKCKELIPKY